MNPNLNKALAGVTAAIQAHEENVTEAAALFAAGKLAQEDLDQAIRERNAALSRRAALQAAVKAAEARDEEADKQAEVAARKAAARKANELLDERDKCAEELDSAINALVTTLARYDEINGEIFTEASAVGVDLLVRQHALNMRAIGGLLTTRLARASNLAAKMEINANRFDAFADVSALAAHTGGQVRAHLERAVR